MQHKSTTGPIHIKSDEQGTFSAVFATFNVIDKDGDVTEPGAFIEGQEVVISAYQHTSWQGALPVGMGKIRQTATEAIVDGKFFLDTTEGLNTYRTVKHLSSRGKGEWSYGFDVKDAAPGKFEGKDVQFLRSLDTHEVSPVLIGAGVNTRTLDMKSRKEGVVAPETYAAAIRPHETRTNTKKWDLKSAQAGLPGDMSIDDLRAVHAYVKAEGDPADRKSYGFLHHDSPGGDANLRACLSGIAQLNTETCGLTPAERKAVYDHLAQHMDDGDLDAPEFKSTPGGDLKFYEEAADVMMRLDRLATRAGEVMALRRSKGKAIAAPTVLILEWVSDSNRKLRSLLDSPQEDADREFARYIRSLHIQE
jgi:hypothetical protein